MSTITSWENIPTEIWITILEKLPIKSQVSLGCTCKRMYRLSLDPFFENLEQRTWIYLDDNLPLPDLLAKAITILRIPPPEDADKNLEQKSLFFKREIQRMNNLQKLIIEEKAWKDDCRLSFSDLHEVFLQHDLVELKVPGFFLDRNFLQAKTFSILR